MTSIAGWQHLMPLPAAVELADAPALPELRRLQPQLTGVRTERLQAAVDRCIAALRRSARGEPATTEIPLPLVIDCRRISAAVPQWGDDESYVLDVSARGVEVTAETEWGALHGLTTLTQLGSAAEPLPALRITDAPRFGWRGLMLDVARHFLPLPDVLRTLDAMATFKLNVLHLHLSDDQGFRFPSARFPRLPSGEHYSPAEIRALVKHAAERGIRVVPELDVPGHSTCWLRAYPEWGNRAAVPSRRFGVHEACLDPTRPEVLEAVTLLFREVTELFPDHFVHLGGDEVHPAWWRDDPGIRAWMRDRGLGEVADLQAWFTRQVAAALEDAGRRVLGWDEVLHPELPRSVAVQAWRGATARDRALAAGHDCLVSAPYYLDLHYPADLHYRFDPEAPEAALLALEDAMLTDPRLSHVAAGMAWTAQWRDEPAPPARPPAGRLLGAEACLWGELVDHRVLDVRLWSRMPAVAERFWSPVAVTDLQDLQQRLDGVFEALPAWAGVDVAGDCWRLCEAAGVKPPWRPLVEMLEPVKWYGRLLGDEALAARLAGREMPQARPYDADTPLNRVADALPPESRGARRLATLLAREQRGSIAARQALRALADEWRTLPATGCGPAELEPAAERLRGLGYLLRELLEGRGDAAAAQAVLQAAAPPVGEYLLAPVPALQSWLAARSSGAVSDGETAP